MSCNKPLKGRVDKKFCDDYCRNNYNNKLKALDRRTIFMRSVNRALTKNRRVIIEILGERDKATVMRDRLVAGGFIFEYHTHLYKTKSGNTYYYNYEYGYLPLENNWVLLVKGNG